MIRGFSLAFSFGTGSLWPLILAATALPPQAIGYPLGLFLSWRLNLLVAEWWIRRARSSQHRNLPAGLDHHAAHRTTTSTQIDGGRAIPAAPGAPPRQSCAADCSHWAPPSWGLATGWHSRRARSMPGWRPSVSVTSTCCGTWPRYRWRWAWPRCSPRPGHLGVPVLAITLFQFTLHTLNHLLDIGQAEPSWLGSAKALVLGWRPPLALTLHVVRQLAAHRASRSSRIEQPRP
jgi:hypothetical protein